jgi:hypothetical protein
MPWSMCVIALTYVRFNEKFIEIYVIACDLFKHNHHVRFGQ